MAHTVAIEGTVKGKALAADAQAKVHEALAKTLEAQLKGEAVIIPSRHASIHASVVYDKE
jgi:hypothetical protein